MIFFGTSLALGSALECFLDPLTELVITSYHIKSTFHHMSQSNPIEKWFIVVRVREDDTSNWWFLWLVISSQGTHLLSFFTFPLCFKCWMTIEWLTLNSWATSCIAVKRINFDNGSQLVIVNFQCLATVLFIFKSLVSFAKLPQPPM